MNPIFMAMMWHWWLGVRAPNFKPDTFCTLCGSLEHNVTECPGAKD